MIDFLNSFMPAIGQFDIDFFVGSAVVVSSIIIVSYLVRGKMMK